MNQSGVTTQVSAVLTAAAAADAAPSCANPCGVQNLQLHAYACSPRCRRELGSGSTACPSSQGGWTGAVPSAALCNTHAPQDAANQTTAEPSPVEHRAVLVVCLGIYVADALIGFDDYRKICLSADRVLWHGEGVCADGRDIADAVPYSTCLHLDSAHQEAADPELPAAVGQTQTRGSPQAVACNDVCCPWHAVWSFFTAAVFHMGALHVAFNMLAFVPIGAKPGLRSHFETLATDPPLCRWPSCLSCWQERRRLLTASQSIHPSQAIARYNAAEVEQLEARKSKLS